VESIDRADEKGCLGRYIVFLRVDKVLSPTKLLSGY
jgi:hypothetical protein